MGAVVFIEFTHSNGHLSATLQEAYLSEGGGQVATHHISISGSVSGLDVTLSEGSIAGTSGTLTKYDATVQDDTGTIGGYVTTTKGYVTKANQLCSSVQGMSAQ